MLFDTYQYWLFFFATFTVYALLHGKSAKMFIACASLCFYAFWDVRFLALLIGSALFNFYSAHFLYRANEKQKNIWLIFGVVSNLVVLGFFKYYNFFIESLGVLFHVRGWGILNIILPVGISFFTFEGIAYHIDVYRKTVKPARSLLDFFVFLTLFPHLIAGPIIRPHDFFPQLKNEWNINGSEFRWGVFQIMKGMAKKTIFANFFAKYADLYFQNINGNQIPALVGVVCFGLQIYFDFAGYTDIARGCAQILGFRFPPNFDRPYFAKNISEFWRRWHMSLSFWLRDYLYFPLGGSRVGEYRTLINLIIVMSLGGIWHGASWGFMLWGAYHGVLLVIHRVIKRVAKFDFQSKLASKVYEGMAWLATLCAVFIGWIPFRAANIGDVPVVLKNMLFASPIGYVKTNYDIMIFSGIVIAYCFFDKKRIIEEKIIASNNVKFCLLAGGGAWVISVFMVRDFSLPFIYFQF